MCESSLEVVPAAPKDKAIEGIRFYIMEHRLEPGDALPSERDLAEMIGVSRMALRGAIAHLVASHELVARQGAGTFLAKPPIMQVFEDSGSFSVNAQAMGYLPGSRLLEAEVLTAPEDVALRLEIPLGELAFHLRRVRLVDGMPCTLDDTWVNRRLCPGIESHDYCAESLYEVLAIRFDVRVRHGEERISITTVDAGEAVLLGLEPGDPVFFCSSVERDAERAPIEYNRQLIRPDRYRFASDSVPEDLRAVVGREWID